MATVHQQSQEKRPSSGKDILSRMLQLEKLSQQHRHTSINSSTSFRPRSPSLHNSPQAVSQQQPTDRLRSQSSTPCPLQRSQTAPQFLLDIDTKEFGLSMELPKIGDDHAAGVDSPADICRSPSWSDYKAKYKDKRRSEKQGKDPSDLDKHKSKGEEMRSSVPPRSTKRLSKKPPAAMDTQRMPAALKRPSRSATSESQPSSQGDSRSSSREGRRSSISSIVSLFGLSKSRSRSRTRSESNTSISRPQSSCPPSSTSRPPSSSDLPSPESYKTVSDGAPQIEDLPRFDHQLRESSASTQGSSGDDGCVRDLVSFAYQLEASSLSPDKVGIQKVKTLALPPRGRSTVPDTPPSSQSDKENGASKAEGGKGTRRRSPPPRSPRRTSQVPRSPGAETVPRDGYLSPKLNGPHGVNASKKETIKAAIDNGQVTFHPPSLHTESPPLTGSSAQFPQYSYPLDSYVHKQRMYQQQRSIAGYEDQMALELASGIVNRSYDSSIGKPGWPHTPSDSTETLREGPSKNVVQEKVPNEKSLVQDRALTERELVVPDEEDSDPYHDYLTKDNQTASGKPSKNPQRMSKIERTLGVSELERDHNSGELAPLKERSSDEKSPRDASTPFFMSSSFHMGFKSKASSADKRLSTMPKENEPPKKSGENKRLSYMPKDSQSPKTNDKKSNTPKPTVPSFVPPDHSRTRTTSSRIMNEALKPSLKQAAPKAPLPRSSTAPVLPSIELQTKDSSPRSKVVSDGSKEVSKVGTSKDKPETKGEKATKDKDEQIPKQEVTTVDQKREFPLVTTKGEVDAKKDIPKSEENVKTETMKNAPKPADAEKAEQEVIVEGVDGDGLVRQTSITRRRSDPEVQISNKTPEIPSLDFLPQLKHQPLVKPKRTSPARVSFANLPDTNFPPSSSSQFPRPSSSSSLSSNPTALQTALKPTFPASTSASATRSAMRASMFGSPQFAMKSELDTKPVAKMFVICCKCKFWHDLPSRLYELMALPRKITREDGIPESVGASQGQGQGPGGSGVVGKGKGKVAGLEGKVFTTVKCPWCEHGMSTACCAGWTAIVYLHERHH